jgi:hypothetical protein
MRLTQHRLDELEGRLSPKQMVLVFIEERRAAGSMVARAQPLLDSYEGAPCQRIEGAIRRSGRLYTTTRSRWRVLSAMRRRRGCS